MKNGGVRSVNLADVRFDALTTGGEPDLEVTATLALVTAALASTNPSAEENIRTEMHDPVRGVTFYSIQLANKQVNRLKVTGGNFLDSDRLTYGVSAMRTPEKTDDAEFILWLRDEEPRWLTLAVEEPVTLATMQGSLDIEYLRASPRAAAIGPLTETVECRVTAPVMDQLLEADGATITVRAQSGVVEVDLSTQEIASLASFESWVSHAQPGRIKLGQL